LAFEPSDTGDAFTLTECAFSEGFIITGTGLYNYDEDSFMMDVQISGLTEGQLQYTRLTDGSIQVSGTFNNQTIDLMETGQ
jgi:hypothetical protein